jgi:hypothetical protein
MFMISPKFNHHIVIVVDIELEAVVVVVLWLQLQLQQLLWRLVLPVLLWQLALSLLLALRLQLPLSAVLHLFQYQLLLQHFISEGFQPPLVVYCLLPVHRHFVLCVLYCLCILYI